MRRVLLFCLIAQVYSLTVYEVPLLAHGSKSETYNIDMRFQLVNPGLEPISVTIVTGDSSNTYTVNPNEAVLVTISNINETLHPVETHIKNRTIVASSSDFFEMQFITIYNGHSEGLQAVQTSDLGSEYYVSTFCDLGGYCQMAIASVEDGVTQVYVKLPPEVDEIGFCIINGTWYSEFNTTITLEYPQTVHIETMHDLTGTRVFSSKPVAVVVGTRTKAGSSPAYHLLEQLVPVPEWGTEFFVLPIGNNSYGNVVHITSHYRRTFVDMSGYPPVELTGKGMTIRRRVGMGSTVYIQASRPVQVMLYTGFTYATYATNETINNVGMTLVPAKEHFRSNFLITCTHNNLDNLMKAQYIKSDDSTYDGFGGTSSITKVPFTHFTFEEYETEVTSNSLYYVTSVATEGFSGIITCESSAIFPISVLTKQATSCTNTIAEMVPGDLIDNDCDDNVDEKYCFENKKFVTTYSVRGNNRTIDPAHIEELRVFKSIKFRLRSCGDIKVELIAPHDDPSETSGKYVISISKVAIVLYMCFPNCSVSLVIDTINDQPQNDCDTLVPYWIARTSRRICVGIGAFPDHDCTSSVTATYPSYYSAVKEMALYGLFSNATFYFDVYSEDCGKVYTDWRCDDLVTNCWEYADDLCTDPTYTDWVSKHCAKFCGVCTPDSVGRMFAVSPPEGTEALQFTIIPRDADLTYMSIVSGNTTLALDSTNVTHANGSVFELKSKYVSVTDSLVHTVFTNADVNLFVTALSPMDDLTIPVYPLDALGTEYMTLAFTYDINCDIISSDGPAKIWKSSANDWSYLGVAYPNMSIQFTSTECVGTVLTSNRPVAVFCYDTENDAYIFWNQLIPTSSWGNHYIIPELNLTDPSVTFTTKARVVTNRANTLIHIVGDFDATYILSERGDYKDLDIDPSYNYTITSNFPISVAVRYKESAASAESFLILPSVDNYGDAAVLFYDKLSWTSHLSVVTHDGEVTSDNVTGDGAVYVTFGNSSYAMSSTTEVYLVRHPVQQSTHLVKDFREDERCTLTVDVAGDGVDSDCDGHPDEEETCMTGYGSQKDDYDLDGWFGEDCLLVATGSSVEIPPKIPVCYTPFIEKNDSYCWSPCSCPCTWMEVLAEYTNMTQAERDSSNSIIIQEYWKALKVETDDLSATSAEKQSAEDSRPSSTNIGISGIILLSIVFSCIISLDLINVYNYFKSKRQTNVE